MLSILLSIFVVQSYAHDIEVKNADGVSIYYKLMNGKKEVAVSFRGDRYDSYSYEYQGDVVIPEYVIYGGEKYLVTSIGERAFYDCKVLSSVVIPKSVTFIGNSAFVNCTSITSLAIPNSVTFIGNSAFSGCKGITSLTIPNGVTYIDIGAFGGCTGITSVTIPESVTYIGSNVFYGCSSLESIVLPENLTSLTANVFKESGFVSDADKTNIKEILKTNGIDEFITI